jgi:hypothetical protein
MEQRFGHDFGQVRVHANNEAATAARAAQARAYTVGRDIVFGSGEYLPTTIVGKQLVAHELAHVIQQERGGTSPPPLPCIMLEQVAGAAAAAFVAGRGAIQVAGASAPGVARQPLTSSHVLTGNRPQSLEGSLLKDEEHLDNEALEQEIKLIEEWLKGQPSSAPESDHLRLELEALQLEQFGRKTPAHKSAETTTAKVGTTANVGSSVPPYLRELHSRLQRGADKDIRFLAEEIAPLDELRGKYPPSPTSEDAILDIPALDWEAPPA